MIIEKIENPENKKIGTSNGFLALKSIFLTKKVKSHAIIVSNAKIWLARIVMPKSSNEPTLSKGNKKATIKRPKQGFLKIVRVKKKKMTIPIKMIGASFKK